MAKKKNKESFRTAVDHRPPRLVSRSFRFAVVRLSGGFLSFQSFVFAMLVSASLVCLYNFARLAEEVPY